MLVRAGGSSGEVLREDSQAGPGASTKIIISSSYLSAPHLDGDERDAFMVSEQMLQTFN